MKQEIGNLVTMSQLQLGSDNNMTRNSVEPHFDHPAIELMIFCSTELPILSIENVFFHISSLRLGPIGGWKSGGLL